MELEINCVFPICWWFNRYLTILSMNIWWSKKTGQTNFVRQQSLLAKTKLIDYFSRNGEVVVARDSANIKYIILQIWGSSNLVSRYITAEKMKFSIKHLFGKCDQIRSFLSHLLNKSLMENFIFVYQEKLNEYCIRHLMMTP